jgi:mycothiol synthase
MEQLTYRPCQGEADIASIMELVRACRTSGPPYHWLPGHELRRRLGGGLGQEAAETRLWLDGRGDLVAFGSIWDGSLLVFGVEPGVQHYEDLLLRVLSWGRARVRELGRLHGEQAVLCVPLHADDAATGALLEREGCTLSQWQQFRLRRPLSAPVPTPQLPVGFTLQCGVRAVDLEQYSALHQDIGLGGAETSEEQWERRSSSAYRPDLDLIAVAPSGELAALCLGFLETERVGPHGEREGWVDLVGTRREYRALGLARALLLLLLQRLEAYGLGTAWLLVDGANSAALGLFGSAGFRQGYTVRWYIHELGG